MRFSRVKCGWERDDEEMSESSLGLWDGLASTRSGRELYRRGNCLHADALGLFCTFLLTSYRTAFTVTLTSSNRTR